MTVETAVRPPAFGLMHQMWAMPDVADAEFLDDTIEAVKLADELGFDSVWLAEHHYVREAAFYSRLPDPEILLARLIGETNQIRLGTGIKILYLDDPVRAAERLRLLNVLSGGRAMFGVGQGSPDELGTRSLSTEERRLNFRERLSEFTQYVSGELVDGRLKLVPTDPVPLLDCVWAGVRDPVSVELAAQLGVNFILGEAEPGRQQSPFVANYLDSGGKGETRGARLVCIAATEGEAIAAAAEPGRRLYSQFSTGYLKQAVADGALPAEAPADDREVFARLEFAVGTPEMVAERLADYVTVTGVDALNIVVHTPGIDPCDARVSLELFMADVAPQLSPVITDNRRRRNEILVATTEETPC